VAMHRMANPPRVYWTGHECQAASSRRAPRMPPLLPPSRDIYTILCLEDGSLVVGDPGTSTLRRCVHPGRGKRNVGVQSLLAVGVLGRAVLWGWVPLGISKP
jgi:hypothetical protein